MVILVLVLCLYLVMRFKTIELVFKSLYNCCLSQNIYFLAAFLFCEHSAKVSQKWQDHSRIKPQPSWQGDEEGWWCSVNSKVALRPMWSSQCDSERSLTFIGSLTPGWNLCSVCWCRTHNALLPNLPFSRTYSPRPIILHNHWHEQMCNTTSSTSANTIKYVLA